MQSSTESTCTTCGVPRPPTYDEARAASIKRIEEKPITVSITTTYKAASKAMETLGSLRGTIPEETRRSLLEIVRAVERAAASERFDLVNWLIHYDD